jgi:uncharacterized protein (TIRG00374 family)
VNGRAVRTAARLLVSLAVSALFGWLSLRHTDLRAVLRTLAGARALPLLGYLAILLAVHLVRTVRWGLLLDPIGHVGFRRLNSASAVGFMLLVLLPLRLGELARPLLIARSDEPGAPRISRSGAMASCVVERVIDGIALGVLGVLALRLVGQSASGAAAEFARRAAWIVTAAFGALCAFLVLAFLARDRVVTLVRALLRPLLPRLADLLAGVLDSFIGALRFGSRLHLLAILGLTALHWALHVAGFAMIGPAFGLQLSVLMACTVLAVQAVGVMVPAGPGMIGTSQFFTQAGLAIFFPGALSSPAVAARAAGYANAIWLLQLGQQVALGLAFLASARLGLAGLLSARASWSAPAPAADGSPSRRSSLG